MEKKMLEKVIR
jgi:DNA repair exonuclease SbcCD ATPase subunit